MVEEGRGKIEDGGRLRRRQRSTGAGIRGHDCGWRGASEILEFTGKIRGRRESIFERNSFYDL